VATPIKRDVTLRPPAADTATLSEADRRTFNALFRQPAGQSLKRANVIALLRALGIRDEHRVRKLNAKAITGDEVQAFRQILAQAGFSAGTSARTGPAKNTSRKRSAVVPRPPHLLVVVEHHEARIYRLEARTADPPAYLVERHDPHHFRHHLTDRDLYRGPEGRAPEDPSFYASLAEALAAARAIIVVGHGAGHSNADRLVQFLRLNHNDTFQKVKRLVVEDLSQFIPQLMGSGREASNALPCQPAATH
jgi:hypothetical protein